MRARGGWKSSFITCGLTSHQLVVLQVCLRKQAIVGDYGLPESTTSPEASSNFVSSTSLLPPPPTYSRMVASLDSLPPEIIDEIVSHVVSHLHPYNHHRQLRIISLFNKTFAYPAQERLFSFPLLFGFRELERFKVIVCGKSKGKLAGMVRGLMLRCTIRDGDLPVKAFEEIATSCRRFERLELAAGVSYDEARFRFSSSVHVMPNRLSSSVHLPPCRS